MASLTTLLMNKLNVILKMFPNKKKQKTKKFNTPPSQQASIKFFCRNQMH